MKLPNFLIIGAQKSGTAWLAKNLRQHPDIFIHNGEIHFFPENNFIRGVEYYKKYFIEANGQKVLGEKSTSYLWVSHSPEIPKNIHATLPEVKLIAVLRNPVNRAISAFNHCLALGQMPPDCGIDDILAGDKQYLADKYGLIEMGKYYTQLKRYYELFDRSQLMVLIFEEDILQNPEATLKNICEFLGVDSSFPFQDIKRKRNAFRSSRAAIELGYRLPHMRKIIRFVDLSIFHLFLRYFQQDGAKPKILPSESIIQQMYLEYREENKKLFDLLERKPVVSWSIDSQS